MVVTDENFDSDERIVVEIEVVQVFLGIVGRNLAFERYAMLFVHLFVDDISFYFVDDDDDSIVPSMSTIYAISEVVLFVSSEFVRF